MQERRPAKIWIVHTTATGAVKPFEVHFQAKGGREWVAASCKTREGAVRSIPKTLRRNQSHYDIEVVAD